MNEETISTLEAIGAGSDCDFELGGIAISALMSASVVLGGDAAQSAARRYFMACPNGKVTRFLCEDLGDLPLLCLKVRYPFESTEVDERLPTVIIELK